MNKRRQCQAHVESTGKRCQKKIRWPKKYCWWHNPKAGPIMLAIISAIISFILTLILSGPLRRVLSPLKPFHFLDKHAPTVVTLSPDVRILGYIDPNTQTFSVACHDDCSGLDLDASKISLFRVRGDAREPLRGRVYTETNRLNLTLDEGLTHGEYVLQTMICDKVKNLAESEYAFVIYENDLIDITISYEDYNEAKHGRLISSLHEKFDEEFFNMQKFYVYHYYIRNKAEKTYCRSIYVSVDNQGCVYSWEGLGGVVYAGVTSVSVSESFDRSLAKNRVFTSQRMLSIEEIAPGGGVNFVALVGFMKFEDHSPKVSSPSEVGVFGTYLSEGYGRTKVENIRRWVPLKKLNSGN